MIPTRAVAAVCCVALGASLGACGGDDDEKADYEKALNTFCTAMERGTTRVQTDAAKVQSSGGSNPTQAVRRIGTVLGRFATTMDEALDTLKETDVPGDYKDFHDDVVNGVDDLVGKLREAAEQAEDGDVQAVRALSGSLTNNLPGLPQELAEKAPACGRIT